MLPMKGCPMRMNQESELELDLDRFFAGSSLSEELSASHEVVLRFDADAVSYSELGKRFANDESKLGEKKGVHKIKRKGNLRKKKERASSVCKKWKQGVKESLARRQSLSFAGWKMYDDSTARLDRHAYNLKKLDIPRSRWGCQITDAGLIRISLANKLMLAHNALISTILI